MVMGRRFVGELKKRGENSLFLKDGRYFQMKEKWAEKAKEKKAEKAGKTNQKKSNQVRIECELIARDALDRAEHMEGKKRTEFLDSVISAVHKRLNTRGSVGLTSYDMEKVSGAIMDLMKAKGKR